MLDSRAGPVKFLEATSQVLAMQNVSGAGPAIQRGSITFPSRLIVVLLHFFLQNLYFFMPRLVKPSVLEFTPVPRMVA